MSTTPVSDRNRLRALRDTGMEFVFWRDAGHRLRVLELVPGRVLAVGRATDNDIVFTHVAVSKHHLTLTGAPHGGWTLNDQRSTNGTYVRACSTDDEPPLVSEVFVRIEKGASRAFADLHSLVRLGKRGPCFHVQLADGGRDTVTELEAFGPRVLDRLTSRQLDVLIALCRPKFADPYLPTTSNRELGDELNLSLDGVKTAVIALRRVYAAPDRETLAALAIEEGLAELAAARE